MTEWVEEKKWFGVASSMTESVHSGCFMKCWAVIAVVFLSALAGATTVSDYVKMPAGAHNDLVVNFIDKMTGRQIFPRSSSNP
jgi:hypothetical protein